MTKCCMFCGSTTINCHAGFLFCKLCGATTTRSHFEIASRVARMRTRTTAKIDNGASFFWRPEFPTIFDVGLGFEVERISGARISYARIVIVGAVPPTWQFLAESVDKPTCFHASEKLESSRFCKASSRRRVAIRCRKDTESLRFVSIRVRSDTMSFLGVFTIRCQW